MGMIACIPFENVFGADEYLIQARKYGQFLSERNGDGASQPQCLDDSIVVSCSSMNTLSVRHAQVIYSGGIAQSHFWELLICNLLATRELNKLSEAPVPLALEACLDQHFLLQLTEALSPGRSVVVMVIRQTHSPALINQLLSLGEAHFSTNFCRRDEFLIQQAINQKVATKTSSASEV